MLIDVVLCRECKHYYDCKCGLLELKVGDVTVEFGTEQNDYCSDGERIEDD